MVFVALEIQTNTESNIISVAQNYSANWMIINGTIAGNPGLAEILENGLDQWLDAGS